MFALRVFTFLLISSVTIAWAYPTPMEQMMSPEPSQRYGASSSDPEQSRLVEISLPLKIRTREDFIAWITYAMKMMASRINITLAAGDNDSNVKLSTASIIQSTMEPEVVSRSPLMMQNTEHASNTNPQAIRVENPPAASDIMANLENFFKTMFGFGEPNNFPKPNSDDGKAASPFVKFFSDVTVNNPYDESSSKVYREPEVFSPFSSPGIYLPIPLKSGYIDDQLMNTYYNMIGHNMTSKPSSTSLKLVPMDTNQVDNSKKMSSLQVQATTMKSKDEGMSTPTPIISVPFEAFITIARDTLQNPAPSESTKMKQNNMNMMKKKPTNEMSTSFADSPESQMSNGVQVFFEDETPTVENKKKPEKKKEKSRKRQTSALQSLLRMLTLRGKKNATSVDVGTPSVLNVFQAVSGKLPGAKFDQFPVPNRGKRNETSQNQDLLDDFDDDPPSSGGFDDDEEEDMGSLGSITDLLPLVIPILEDLSDPESEVDLLELLMAGIPLLEGLSDENDPEAIDIVGTLGPVLLKLSGGAEGPGSDSGAVLTPLIGLVAPIIGPLSGPLIGPLFRSSSGPDRVVDLTSLLQGVLGPLSRAGPDGMSPISTLTANLVASLLQTLSKPGSGIDIGSLVSAVLSGASAGTSSGLSGGSHQKHKEPVGYYTAINTAVATAPKRPREPVAFPAQASPSHVARPPQGYVNYPKQPMAYYNIYGYPAPIPMQPVVPADPEGLSTTYGGYGPVPANTVNPKELIGQSIKDIFGAASGLIGAIVNTSAGLSGASSAKADPVYGPPVYGPPARPPPPPYIKA